MRTSDLLVGKIKTRDKLEDEVVDGRIILSPD
jgi:hypothetical protein